jgi:hypothetical protein
MLCKNSTLVSERYWYKLHVAVAGANLESLCITGGCIQN